MGKKTKQKFTSPRGIGWAVKTPAYEKIVEVFSLAYDFKDKKFNMSAGGHRIVPLRSFQPVSLSGQWSTIFVRFATSQEAEEFCQWLKQADNDAENSFARMTD